MTAFPRLQARTSGKRWALGVYHGFVSASIAAALAARNRRLAKHTTSYNRLINPEAQQ